MHWITFIQIRELSVKQRLEKLFQEKVNGKTVLITGASSGIGLTAAHRLADAGAHVLLVARTKETLDEVKAEIEAKAEALAVASQKLGEIVYAQAQAEANAGGAEAGASADAGKKKDDDVVDADFTEVKDDKK